MNIWKSYNWFSLMCDMSEKDDAFHEHDLFVTEFPKKQYGIVDYLQGRVHFAILDQIKLMNQSGMSPIQIRETVIRNVTEIIDNFKFENKSKDS